MLKHLHKTMLIASLGTLSFQNSVAQCPLSSSPIFGDTICLGNVSASIQLPAAQAGTKFVALLGSERIDSIVSTSNSSSFLISTSKLLLGKNNIAIQANAPGCPTVNFKDSAAVLINTPPNPNLKVVGSTYCSGAETAIIIIYGTKPGEIYQAYIDTNPIGASVESVTDTLALTIPTGELQRGLNQIVIKATAVGCGSVMLTNKATVNPMPFVDYFFSVVGDTICSSSSFAELTFKNTSPQVNHQIYLNNNAVLDPFIGANSDFVKRIPSSFFAVGQNKIMIQAALQHICGTTLINTTANVLVHPAIKFDEPVLIGDTVTMPVSFATIKVMNPEVGVSYQAFQAGNILGNSVISFNSSSPLELTIPVGPPNGLDVGANEVSVAFVTIGCENKTISDTTIILVKPQVISALQKDISAGNFSLYPNPFHSELHFSSNLNSNVKIQIVDAFGKIVHQQTMTTNDEVKIDPNLSKGLYFVQWETEGKRELTKLIKE